MTELNSMETNRVSHCAGNRIPADLTRFLCTKRQERPKQNRFLGTDRGREIDAVAEGRQEVATSLQSKHDSTGVERFMSPLPLSHSIL